MNTPDFNEESCIVPCRSFYLEEIINNILQYICFDLFGVVSVHGYIVWRGVVFEVPAGFLGTFEMPE
jgi:hypothetical protein